VKCPQCGAENDEDSRFCELCGLQIKTVPRTEEKEKITVPKRTEIKPKKELYERIYWPGVLIGTIVIIVCSALSIPNIGYIIIFLIFVVTLVVAYINGVEYKDGIVNGGIIGVIAGISFVILAPFPTLRDFLVALTGLFALIFGLLGVLGGVSGIFIKKQLKKD
jgi:zinc-ribbon domain